MPPLRSAPRSAPLTKLIIYLRHVKHMMSHNQRTHALTAEGTAEPQQDAAQQRKTGRAKQGTSLFRAERADS